MYMYISIALVRPRLLARGQGVLKAVVSVSAREHSLHRFGPHRSGHILFAFSSPTLRTGREFLCGRIQVSSASGFAQSTRAHRGPVPGLASAFAREIASTVVENVAFRFARYGRSVCICMSIVKPRPMSRTVYREARLGTRCVDGLE
jgi:hypothetical protein